MNTNIIEKNLVIKKIDIDVLKNRERSVIKNTCSNERDTKENFSHFNLKKSWVLYIQPRFYAGRFRITVVVFEKQKFYILIRSHVLKPLNELIIG